MVRQRIIRCTLSGTFHRDRLGLESIYNELIQCGCQVLSPHRIDFVSNDDSFVKDQAEERVDHTTIENHHLVSIKQSDFLWVFAPSGYIGLSTALEIGYAKALGIKIFSNSVLNEPIFNSYVTIIPSVFKAIEIID